MIKVQIKRFFICRLLDLMWKVEMEIVDRLPQFMKALKYLS
jgi:hypothetical protein